MLPCRRLLHAVCWLLCAVPVRVSAQVAADSTGAPVRVDSAGAAGAAAVPAGLPDSAPLLRRARKAVGAVVGYSRSDLGGKDAQHLQSREGALTGVYLQLPLAAPLSVRSEVLFALMGGRADARLGGAGSVPLDIEIAYIELPLLLRLAPGHGRIRPTFFAGPAPALQIGCNRLGDSTLAGRLPCNEAQIGSVRSLDVGVVAGAGVEVRWPQSALALEARYTTGMRSVIEGSDVKNRALGILLALTF